MSKATNAKRKHLRESGTLNAHPQQVSDVLFVGQAFFDPEDLLQVKYEMLRRVQREGWPVSQAARTFGFSRPSYYKMQADFVAGGLGGLVPRKRGPKGGHKLSPEVVAFAAGLRAKQPALSAPNLAERIAGRFGLTVHPRSIERALKRREKKRRQND